MRIVVWGINYAPELTGIAPYNTALCEFLRGRGHDVAMVTTFSYYPTWRKNPEDRRLLYRTDHLNGVPVHRCWHFVPRQVTPPKRIWHEATFVFTSMLRVLFLKRPDVFVIVSPPLLLGFAAWVTAVLKRTLFVFHVQDLQPDAAVGLGMLKRGWFTRALFALESLAYAKAARVSGISREMLAAFCGKGVPETKLLLFPNSVVLPERESVPNRGLFRARHQLGEGKFLATYAGNIGIKQGLSVLVSAAQTLGKSDVQIVICGEGSDRDSLNRQIEAAGLKNVTLLGLLSQPEYEEMLGDTDVCLITQQAGAGNAFFPSKLLTTLAYGKPVITVADDQSALARAVREGGFGVNVSPNDPGGLTAVLKNLATDRGKLAGFGEAGRIFVQQFERTRVLTDFAAELETLA